MLTAEWVEAWGELKTVLAGMDAPSGGRWWDADPALSEQYLMGLTDVPAALVRQMAQGVSRKYATRPAVKTLRDWALEIKQAKPSDLRVLTDTAGAEGKPLPHRPASPQLTGPGGSAISVLTDAARRTVQSGGVISAEARAIIRGLKEREAAQARSAGRVIVSEADAGDWGIETKSGSSVERMPARWSEAKARAMAAEQAAKYPHLVIGVWCKSDAVIAIGERIPGFTSAAAPIVREREAAAVRLGSRRAFIEAHATTSSLRAVIACA